MLNAKTRALVAKYSEGLAAVSQAKNGREMFSLLPPHQNTLHEQIMHTEEFLQLITMLMVEQVKGQVVYTGNPQLFTGRVKDGRFNRQLDVDGNQYELYETDSGSYLPYTTLTTWANAGTEDEFLSRIQAFSNRSFALDMLRIGFNGTSAAAANSNPEENPNGEDVNIGWHQIVKNRSPGQIITDIPIFDRAAANADANSVDALVADLKFNYIREEFRSNPDLVVLIGADLLAADVVTMMNKVDRPTEKVAAGLIGRDIAGMKAYTPPYFPSRRLVVTTTKNLHLYTQANTGFRRADWVDDRKRFENNYLRTEGYAIEYDELYAGYDEIQLGENTEGEVKEVAGSDEAPTGNEE
ncbi:phage major capsid protein, P2 family [Providencia rettgeri]